MVPSTYEPRRVRLLVLDRAGKDGQAPALGRRLAGDRRRAFLERRKPRRL
jgi:hypothetical protein